jgi:hypothetical protein
MYGHAHMSIAHLPALRLGMEHIHQQGPGRPRDIRLEVICTAASMAAAAADAAITAAAAC